MDSKKQEGREVKGARTPRGHLDTWTILSWRQQSRFCTLRGNFCSSFNYLQEFKLQVFPIISMITRNNLLWPIYRAGQTSYDGTSAVLTILQMTSSPSEGPGHLTSFLSPECHTLKYFIISLFLFYKGGKKLRDRRSLVQVSTFPFSHPKKYSLRTVCWPFSFLSRNLLCMWGSHMYVCNQV